MAHAGHAATASLSAVASASPPRFHGSTIRREDVECLGRKPETGGTPTHPGVEFVRYRRSCGLGFRQTAPKNRRMAVRAVFRARQGCGGGMTWMAATQSARDPPTGGSSSPRRSRPSSRLAVRRGLTSTVWSATTGPCSVVAPATEFGVGAPRRPPLPWRAGHAGVRGGAAPRQPRSGTRGVWPQRVGWLVCNSGPKTSSAGSFRKGTQPGTVPDAEGGLTVAIPAGRDTRETPTRRITHRFRRLPPPHPFARSCGLPGWGRPSPVGTIEPSSKIGSHAARRGLLFRFHWFLFPRPYTDGPLG